MARWDQPHGNDVATDVALTLVRLRARLDLAFASGAALVVIAAMSVTVIASTPGQVQVGLAGSEQGDDTAVVAGAGGGAAPAANDTADTADVGPSDAPTGGAEDLVLSLPSQPSLPLIPGVPLDIDATADAAADDAPPADAGGGSPVIEPPPPPEPSGGSDGEGGPSAPTGPADPTDPPGDGSTGGGDAGRDQGGNGQGGGDQGVDDQGADGGDDQGASTGDDGASSGEGDGSAPDRRGRGAQCDDENGVRPPGRAVGDPCPPGLQPGREGSTPRSDR